MGGLDILLALVLPSLILIHLLIAPFTKVEESFNIQAIHDLTHFSLLKPLSSQPFDHFSFPGAVPRTFVGATVLSILSKPFLLLLSPENSVFYPQIIVRAILGLLNAAALLWYKDGLKKAFGGDVARWWLLLLGSQFHVLFYASRTLPNMFAFGLTTIALRQALPIPGATRKEVSKRQNQTLTLFIVAGIIFRAEIAILIFSHLSFSLSLLSSPASLSKQIPRIIKYGLLSALLALAISVPLDSYLWRRPIWPEFAGFYFNAIQGNSADWGTSPYSHYFVSLLPRLLQNPLILMFLIPLSLFLPGLRTQARGLVLPAVLFVAIYSIQPHKESRFIIYIIPPVTASAALSASYLWMRRGKALIYRVGTLVVILSIAGSFLASTGQLLVSSLNYPGGEALSSLHGYIRSHPHNPTADSNAEISIHMDVLSCMTGVTQFQQYSSTSNPTITYDKTEAEKTLLDPTFWTQFDYALMEHPGKAIGKWEVIGSVFSFAGIEILRPGQVSPVHEVEKIYGVVNETSGVGEARVSEEVVAAVEEGLNQDEVLFEGANEERGSKSKILSMTDLRKSFLKGEVNKFHILSTLKETIRSITGGWYIGPRLEERIFILRRLS